MSIFRRPNRYLQSCTSGAQRRGDRAIGPYDYISCGETSEGDFGESLLQYRIDLGRSGSSLRWTRLRWCLGVQGGVDGHKISFFLWAWFSCDEQKDC